MKRSMDLKQKLQKTARCLTALLLLTCLLGVASGMTPVLAESVPKAAQAQQSALPLGAPTDAIDAKAVYMVNLNTNTVVFAKNEHEKLPPASVTKIMTILVALEAGYSLDTQVTAQADLWDEFAGISISNADIRAGEVMTLRDLLYCAALPSANEAASVIANFIGQGSRTKFLALMNRRAAELGATDTHFADPHGLADENHYTTAADLYQIARAAIQNPDFLQIVGTASYTLEATNFHQKRTIKSTNAMMDTASPYYVEGVCGMKTGSTPKAGRCFVGLCEQRTGSTDGKKAVQYLTVVLGSPLLNQWGGWRTDNAALKDTKTLLTWGYSNLSFRMLLQKDQQISAIDVTLCAQDQQLMLKTAGDIAALVPAGETDNIHTTVKCVFDTPSLEAPVKAGQQVGYAHLLINGQDVGRVPLVTVKGAERSEWLAFLAKLATIWKDNWLLIVLACVVIVLVILLLAVRKSKQRNQRLSRSSGMHGAGRKKRKLPKNRGFLFDNRKIRPCLQGLSCIISGQSSILTGNESTGEDE